MIEHLESRHECFWRSRYDRSPGCRFVHVPKGPKLNVRNLVGAFFTNKLFKCFEPIVHIQDEEFVACGDEGGEGAGFAAAAIAHQEHFGVFVGLVVVEGGHGSISFVVRCIRGSGCVVALEDGIRSVLFLTQAHLSWFSGNDQPSPISLPP